MSQRPDRPDRSLPVLDVPPPAPSVPREPFFAPDARLAEFRPDARALPSFWVWTLGCQMNRSDSEEMAGRLLAAGCPEAPSMEAAGIIVINTCAIREAAEAKVIGRQGHLTRLKRADPGVRVVLTGCAVRERDRTGLARRFPAVDLFLRPDEEPEIVSRLGLASAQAPIGEPAATAATTLTGQVPVSDAVNLARSRASVVAGAAVARGSTISAWLPIVYGCDKTCTYCIVPFSRGPERSRPFDDVITEASELVAAGFREVTLLGQNVNSYGHDLPVEPRFAHVREGRRAGRRLDRAGRPDLAELIAAIDGLRGADGRPAIPRLRFVTSHPWDLSDRLIRVLADADSVCEHLHLPVQSGADSMLRRMGRQYTVEHYLERLASIRAAVPGIAVSTDVIVGFCGETGAEFEATLDLLRHVRFDQVFAAVYSERPGTPATRMVDDVPPEEKRRRLNHLLETQERIGHERNRAWLGRTTEVLVDTISRDPSHEHDDAGDPGSDGGATRLETGRGQVRLAGRTRENKLVHFAGSPDLLGRFVDVRVDHAGPYSLRGSIEVVAPV
jgi:tRNA-2-methylthio-N6-dimethylallyladenosine synthase